MRTKCNILFSSKLFHIRLLHLVVALAWAVSWSLARASQYKSECRENFYFPGQNKSFLDIRHSITVGKDHKFRITNRQQKSAACCFFCLGWSSSLYIFCLWKPGRTKHFLITTNNINHQSASSKIQFRSSSHASLTNIC